LVRCGLPFIDILRDNVSDVAELLFCPLNSVTDIGYH